MVRGGPYNIPAYGKTEGHLEGLPQLFIIRENEQTRQSGDVVIEASGGSKWAISLY